MTVTIHDLRDWRSRGQKFVMVTCYDALSARVMEDAGVPVFLVGDTLAQVMLGYETTLPVTMDEMLHHARAVARGSREALLVGDLPFMTYHTSTDDAIRNAGAYLQVGMHAVKLEGGGRCVEIVRALTDRGIPVMGHLGLTPQSVNMFGGYKVQGRGDAGDRVVADAKALEEAGAFSIVLECVPSELGKRVTEAVGVPTIGIGAGPHTDAQVLVYHDLLGITSGPAPRFVKRYANLGSEIAGAVKTFAKEVAEGIYPGPEHSYLTPLHGCSAGTTVVIARIRDDDMDASTSALLAEHGLVPGRTITLVGRDPSGDVTVRADGEPVTLRRAVASRVLCA